jgi:malonyl-CoA O-methyltransferase
MARVLPASEAYRLWAPTYEEAGALPALDEAARMRLDPSPEPPLLDVACGTGRRLRLRDGHPRGGAFGVDLVLPMLLSGARGLRVAVADLRALPFPSSAFRRVWCRLAVGHVPDLPAFYRDLARVLGAGGRLFVTDFHPDASRRGMLRSFPSGGGTVAVEHHLHEVDDHRDASKAAGLVVEELLELPAGDEVRPFFEAAGRLEAWERQRDLPVLLALRLRRP